jgi:hypothetical protein
MKVQFFSVILMTFGLFAFGQEPNSNAIKRININEFYVHTGFSTGHNSTGTLADFKLLAPNSVLLNSNMADFKQSNSTFFYTSNANTMFSVMLGIQFSDKQKTKYKNSPQLRVGITYSSGTTFSGSLYNEERKPYDTLTSSQTGQTILIDSLLTKNLGMNYSSEQLRFDASLIFRTNPEARWSLYSGIGLTAGLSINSNTQVFYSKFNRAETQQPNNNYYYSYHFGGNYETEKHKNNNNMGFSSYIPLGVDFKIGNKREFWKRTHIYYELRPSINITSVPELRTFTNTCLQQGLGVKVSW